MLYHFSEDPSITRFVPRPPLAHPEADALVWAIHEDHQQIYWVPRDCPRIYFWPHHESTAEDLERFWTGVGGRMVVAIEAAWLPRLQATRLYRYTMPPDTFTLFDTNYGGYVSRQAVEPLTVEPFGNLLDELAASVELRICPSLVPLGRAIIGTSLSWGLIRMRNAQGWTTA